jgi:hypothetical protein
MIPRGWLLRQTAASRDDPFPVDTTYWLSRCEGFCVVRADGRRAGAVSGVRYTTDIGCPSHLVVTGGWLGTRETVVPVGEVARITPAASEVVVNVAGGDQPRAAGVVEMLCRRISRAVGSCRARSAKAG